MSERRSRGLSPAVRVGLLTAALVGVWPFAWSVSGPRIPTGMVVPPWWLFLIGVGVTDLWLLRIRTRHQEQGESLSEVPLVVGLFTLGPVGLLVARLIAGGLVVALYRRAAPLKVVFNLGLMGASTTAALVVFSAVDGGASAMTTRGWVAAILACGAAGMVDGGALTLVFAWYEDWPSARAALVNLVEAVVKPMAVAVAALVAALSLCVGYRAVPPLVLAVALLILGYRSYVLLAERHSSLQWLFRLSEDLHDARQVEDVARATLVRAMELLRGATGELVLLQREQSGQPWSATRWFADGGPPEVERVWLDKDLDPALIDLVGPVAAAVIPQRLGVDPTKSLSTRLSVAAGMHAVISINQNDTQTVFSRSADERLLETVAKQATVAMRHAHALRQLTYEAQHDQLTGLPNRASYHRQARAALRKLAEGCCPVVGVLDLDGFKTLNDSLGHHAGDAVIAEVGRRMGAMADGRIFVARMGGDEFALLLRDHESEEEVTAVGRRLLRCLEEDVLVDGHPVSLAGSLGLAVAPRDGTSPDALLRCADLAMYAAKRGSAGMAVFGRDLGIPAGDPVALASDLRLALARGEITVAVQPLVDLRTRSLHSVEVLARWRHPTLGSVEPETFVVAAERGGLTVELSRVILRQALTACRSWLDVGLEVRVAVNLSARAIDDPGLPDRVEAALAEFNVPGRLLTLELTEAGLLDNPERVLAILSRLRELGIRLAIDDFGTGYSSMTYVSALAPDQVKIDKSFIYRLPAQGRDAAIVRSIIDLGKNLDVEVVAEGVSDLVTARAVEKLGCALAQGFLYGEPMPWQALAGWLQRWITTSATPVALSGQGQAGSPEDGGPDRLRLVR